MASRPLAREYVQAALREDALSVVLGILFVALGLTGAALFRLRRRSRDKALLWFAVWALLQGTRLLCATAVVPFLAEPVPAVFWRFAVAAITYTVPIPGTLFLLEVLPGWRPALRWILSFQAAFALAGLTSDQILHRPDVLASANNIMVLMALAAFVAGVVIDPKSAAVLGPLRSGLLILFAAVVVNNLSSLGLFQLPFNPEPPAMAVFFAGLGMVVAKRAFQDQERLSAIDKELEIARRIQTSILPREMPAMNAVSIAARYLPMTAVAGDFYEFLIPDNQHLGILIADVSGHGVPAALIASMVKVAIAGQLPHAFDTARVMAGMNQTLCGKLQGQFVTAAYLFLDFETRMMRYSAAGHPPLLWWSAATRTVEELVENGLILGLLPAAQYGFVERPFGLGDRFLLYTDGLLEASNNEGEFYGDQRLREALSAAPASTDQAATLILEGLVAWSGQDAERGQEDDLTLLVIDAR